MAETEAKTAPPTKTAAPAKGGHGKSAYYSSPEYEKTRHFRSQIRKAASQMNSPLLKGICDKFGNNVQGKAYEQGEVSDLFKGIITREKGWIKVAPGYKVFWIGNSLQDWGIITGLLTILYIFYTAFFIATYQAYKALGDTLMWIYFVAMIIFMSCVGILVGKGYVDDDAREEALRFEQEKAAGM